MTLINSRKILFFLFVCFLSTSPPLYAGSFFKENKTQNVNDSPEQKIPSESQKIDPGTSLAPQQSVDLQKKSIAGIGFIKIPGGCYQMGCGPWNNECRDDEKPIHKVCLDDFWLMTTEVTQKQWKTVMGNNPSRSQIGDEYPVDSVSLIDVQTFISKLNQISKENFRLPTEAEWEYSCRDGGKNQQYPSGGDIDEIAWYKANSNNTSNPVATKKPNALGLFDMSGNILEWVQDSYSPTSYTSFNQNNPLYLDNSTYHVARGGCFVTSEKRIRCTDRSYDKSDKKYKYLGFRLAKQ